MLNKWKPNNLANKSDIVDVFPKNNKILHERIKPERRTEKVTMKK